MPTVLDFIGDRCEMARFDLNGNPLPDDQRVPPPPPPPGPRYDLAGNPLPSQPYSPPPNLPPPPPLPSVHGAPPPTGSPFPPPTTGRYGAAPGQGASYYRPADAVERERKTFAIKWIVGGACLFLLIAILILVVHPAAVPPVTGYRMYTALNGTFTVDQPNGWDIQQLKHAPGANPADDFGMGDSTDSGGVVFSKASAKITIYQGKVDSMSGSVMNSLPPDKLLKSYQDDLLSSKFSNVRDLQDYAFTTEGFGNGKSETWSASGPKIGLPSPYTGYYVALAGGNYYVTVLCECRQSDWDTVKPVFQHVINSMTELAPPGYQSPVPGGEAYPSGPPPQTKPPVNTTPGL
jgi:hypothetical protein